MFFFFHLLPKPRTYFYVRLIDGAARIFLSPYAAARIRTHVSSTWGLLKDALPIELPQRGLLMILVLLRFIWFEESGQKLDHVDRTNRVQVT